MSTLFWVPEKEFQLQALNEETIPPPVAYMELSENWGDVQSTLHGRERTISVDAVLEKNNSYRLRVCSPPPKGTTETQTDSEGIVNSFLLV